jgi:peptide deformylase
MRNNTLKLLRAKHLPILKIYDQNSEILTKPSLYTKMSFNKDIYTYINKLKYTASNASFAYLASNQTYVADSLFVIRKNLKSFVWFH